MSFHSITKNNIIQGYFDYLELQNKYSITTLVAIDNVLNDLCNYAKICKKDVFKLSQENIINMFSTYMWGTSYGVFNNKKTHIVNFLEYCVINNICDSEYLGRYYSLLANQIPNDGRFATNFFADLEGFKDYLKTITEENFSTNDMHIMAIGILYLSWYGFSIPEIVSIENNDLDYVDGTIKCKDTGKSVKVEDKEVLNILHRIQCTETYDRIFGKSNETKRIFYLSTNYLIKPTNGKKMEQNQARLLASHISDRAYDFNVNSEYYGKRLSVKYARENGLMWRIYNAEKETGMKLTVNRNNETIRRIDEAMNSELLQGLPLENHPENTRIRKNLDMYLKWRKYFYGY